MYASTDTVDDLLSESTVPIPRPGEEWLGEFQDKLQRTESSGVWSEPRVEDLGLTRVSNFGFS